MARYKFAVHAKEWDTGGFFQQIFSDEVSASGGPSSQCYVTVRIDGSVEDVIRDRLDHYNLRHKHAKHTSWIFYGTIYE